MANGTYKFLHKLFTIYDIALIDAFVHLRCYEIRFALKMKCKLVKKIQGLEVFNFELTRERTLC